MAFSGKTQIWWLAGGFVLGVVVTASFAGAGQVRQSPEAKVDANTWAPQFPRPGAVKVFENDHVIVWDQTYTDEPFMHRHIRDELNILMEDGPSKLMDEHGVIRLTEHVGPTGKTGILGYYKAGLGPHAEWAADPNHRPRAIYIEFKGTEPASLVNGRWPK